jgi:hypothetical protein
MFVTVDGTPQEIADLLFAVRNRQPEICSPKDTFEEPFKSVLDDLISANEEKSKETQ